ncbi:Cell division protein FtsH [Rhodovulum sp. P5]|uniref:AAA family ATPase n=1 Tax=Rhodovulum sp. P5 TaxID=1564506 RepID=UPI0009C30C27|nr:AAA family ATPase [Rhodovulum sp. P5]ARE42206.1 Cell division protein FtsH [Rhodovulum sp. P5]
MTGPGLHVEVTDAATRGVIRLSRRDLAALNLRPGDTVCATAGRACHGRVSVGAVAEGSALLDRDLAANCDTSQDGRVFLRPADLPRIETLAVQLDTPAPVEPADLSDALFDMALTEGDRLSLTLPQGRTVGVEVMSVSPGGAGLLGAETLVTVQNRPGEDDRLAGIGGMATQIRRVREMIVAPLVRPELFERLGISAPRGVLFSGPPGSGKTLLARAVAAETKAAFFHLNGPEIISKHYGDSEAALRRLFEAAEKQAPSIVFIDEIDAIAPRRDDLSGDKQVERRVVAQLLTLMDGLSDRGRIVVMAATNLPDALDPALRRPGRFDREIRFSPPDAAQRRDILEVHLAKSPLAGDVDLSALADIAHGYVGADLAALVREAAVAALARSVAEAGSEAAVDLENLAITQADLEHGLAVTSPSALRDSAVDAPPVRWEDIGGLDAPKAALQRAVMWPMEHRERFRELGVQPPRGILLTGPPGRARHSSPGRWPLKAG